MQGVNRYNSLFIYCSVVKIAYNKGTNLMFDRELKDNVSPKGNKSGKLCNTIPGNKIYQWMKIVL